MRLDVFGTWDSCELSDLIEDPVLSFQVGAMRPEPAIYAETLRRVGCAASQAVFVGDGGSSELAGPGGSAWSRYGRPGQVSSGSLALMTSDDHRVPL